jgi:hypothetical protein
MFIFSIPLAVIFLTLAGGFFMSIAAVFMSIFG